METDQQVIFAGQLAKTRDAHKEGLSSFGFSIKNSMLLLHFPHSETL